MNGNSSIFGVRFSVSQPQTVDTSTLLAVLLREIATQRVGELGLSGKLGRPQRPQIAANRPRNVLVLSGFGFTSGHGGLLSSSCGREESDLSKGLFGSPDTRQYQRILAIARIDWRNRLAGIMRSRLVLFSDRIRPPAFAESAPGRCRLPARLGRFRHVRKFAGCPKRRKAASRLPPSLMDSRVDVEIGTGIVSLKRGVPCGTPEKIWKNGSTRRSLTERSCRRLFRLSLVRH